MLRHGFHPCQSKTNEIVTEGQYIAFTMVYVTFEHSQNWRRESESKPKINKNLQKRISMQPIRVNGDRICYRYFGPQDARFRRVSPLPRELLGPKTHGIRTKEMATSAPSHPGIRPQSRGKRQGKSRIRNRFKRFRWRSAHRSAALLTAFRADSA